MLKFFFNKNSKIVYVMEALGIACLVFFLATGRIGSETIPSKILFWFFVLEYLFIRFFASVQWYNNEGRKKLGFNIQNIFKGHNKGSRYRGIELQFKKALVPTAYIIPVFSILILLTLPISVLYIAVILMAVIIHVNIILIYFYIKDNETLPVNFYTHNKHLRGR